MLRNALTAFFFFLTLATQAQPFGKLVRKTPGVVSYTFRDSFGKDVPGTLDMIKSMGITDIELSNLFGQTAPAMLMQPLPYLLHLFRYNRAMRFDLSRISEPIHAIDKKGFAIVGSLRSLKVERLMTI